MDEFAPGTPEFDRDVYRTFNEGQARTLKLISQHAPVAEVMASVCELVEQSMSGARALAVRFQVDGELNFVSSEQVDAELRDVITVQLLADADVAQAGGSPDRFELPDPTQPSTHHIWGRVLTGLGGDALGALCVTRDWPDQWLHRTKGAFYSASRLLQIAIEQHRAAQHFAATIASERQRIANGLHDDPIQEITVLSLMLQRIGRDLPDEQRAQVNEARKRADAAIDRMRRMLFELHPATLENDGLAIATEIYLEETMDPIGMAWTVDDQLTTEPDEATAVLIFRLIHEALANVATHSEASHVTVALTNDRGGIGVRIEDDGCGFDPSTVAPHRAGHLGISNVRYLARRTAGHFDVTSAPGAGCTVDIWIPVDHPTPARTSTPPD